MCFGFQGVQNTDDDNRKRTRLGGGWWLFVDEEGSLGVVEQHGSLTPDEELRLHVAASTTLALLPSVALRCLEHFTCASCGLSVYCLWTIARSRGRSLSGLAACLCLDHCPV